MTKVLLLYDTTEKDLARDVKELLSEFDFEILMIPQAPDLGKTLQDKETHYFKGVDGAIFLITAGSMRHDKPFPSPSIADEMGQARQLFGEKPERVIYLVERSCEIQAVDQKGYIPFDRSNMRSVLEAITLLVRNLKAAGLMGPARLERRETPEVDIAEVARRTQERLKNICLTMSHQPNGAVENMSFRQMLMADSMSGQEVNFALRDLQIHGLATFTTSEKPPNLHFFVLTNLGWELVRHEMQSRQDVRGWLQAALESAARGRKF